MCKRSIRVWNQLVRQSISESFFALLHRSTDDGTILFEVFYILGREKLLELLHDELRTVVFGDFIK